MERVSYRGWQNCFRLSDGRVELIITGDVGPRVIRFGPVGGDNLFAEREEEIGRTGGKEWRIYGGHRLWHSPEARLRTYVPDNGPVEVREKGALVALQPVEPGTGIQKELRISLEDGGATVIHRLYNQGLWTVELAPWALSVMAPGGIGIVPVSSEPSDPDRLLPNRVVVLWPYSDMRDPRVLWGRRYVLLRQEPGNARPFKFGVNSRDGWAAYIRNGLLFVKRFKYFPGRPYPDFGCSVEMYTNEWMLELETLGPLVRLEPGEVIEHTERWFLVEGIKVETEDDVEHHVRPRIEGLL
ncbi:MAG TPA: hypothetical protein EYP17_04165 [Candidatus Latescibacteria bacterium]|nr:hypothetical protein [Candidatus Latescibacterota bacterium]